MKACASIGQLGAGLWSSNPGLGDNICFSNHHWWSFVTSAVSERGNHTIKVLEAPKAGSSESRNSLKGEVDDWEQWLSKSWSFILACWSLLKAFPCLLVTLSMIGFSFSDWESPTRAIPVQEAENLEPGKQCAAVPALPGGRADESVADRAAREPPGVLACGAGGVPDAETQWAGGGGGPVQHPALGSQRAPVEGRQRASLNPQEREKPLIN